MKDLMQSKKFKSTIIGVVVVLLTVWLGLPSEASQKIAEMFMLLLAGQGAADWGKEAKKLGADINKIPV